MKIAFLRVAMLCIATLGAATDVVTAQTSPSLFGAPLPRPNGYDALIEAAQNYRHGREGWPTNPTELSPAENLRGQRYSVLRNSKALSQVRAALQIPLMRPAPVVPLPQIPPPQAVPAGAETGATQIPPPNRDPDAGGGEEGGEMLPEDAPFDPEDGFRLLGGLLKQESGFRASSGDWSGAMNSSLDCIQLGVVLTRGATFETARLGHYLENIGRSRLEPIVKKLDAASAASAAARLQTIETLRPPFADIVRLEKKLALERTVQAFEQLDWNDVVTWTRKPDGQNFSAEDSATLLNSGQSEIQAQVSRVFDAAIAVAESPYDPQARISLLGADAWTRMLAQPLLSSRPRVEYLAQTAATALLRSALEVESSLRKSGTLPATLQTSFDPFAAATGAGARLKYRLEGTSFRLYSVGPNGKDDGGIPLSLLAETEITSATPGDLVAPNFAG
ncbi:MAG TPA: hypothetical protein VGB45_07750 [Abditibacterium sp.]|jgi:hypothetical protein